jgi:hypothetical protein
LISFCILPAAFVLNSDAQQGVNQTEQTHPANPLTNKDISSMTKAGLEPAIILAKIRSSATSFDTSADALIELKNAGVANNVIQAMVTSQASASNLSKGEISATAKSTPAADSSSVLPPEGFAISYVPSDQKWQLGFRHEPFNKISEYLVEQIVKNLEGKGIKKVGTLAGGCCKVTIELLSVSTRQAVIKEPGIDVAANVTVTDANNKIVFAKGYKGRSGTATMNTWGHLINHACEDAAKNVSADENLSTILSTGKS